MLKVCVQPGKTHFLSLAEVFSLFLIVTPADRAPNKKAAKVSCLPLQLKEFLIFCVFISLPHYYPLCQTFFLLIHFNCLLTLSGYGSIKVSSGYVSWDEIG